MSAGRKLLLLLSQPPADTSTEAFESCYRPPLTEALLLASKQPHSELDIALFFPCTNQQRRSEFADCQRALAGIYRLGCHICVEKGFEPVQPEYPDFRVYLITDGNAGQDTSATVAGPISSGPIFSPEAIVSSQRAWDTVVALTDAGNDGVAERVISLRRKTHGSQIPFDIVTVPSGPASMETLTRERAVLHSQEDSKQHRVVAVGGTFDNLHEGHKLLLSATALILEPTSGKEASPRRLIVGITGDQLLVNKKYAEMLESWDERQLAVFRFLSAAVSLDPAAALVRPELRNDPGPNGKACIYRLEGGLVIECVEIQDPYGPTITDETISALVVSAETRSGGEGVNKKRTEQGMQPLETFEVDVLGPADSSDLSNKISSTDKRRRRHEQQIGKANM